MGRIAFAAATFWDQQHQK